MSAGPILLLALTSCFQGLYDSSGSPVFPDGMAIAAHNPAYGRKQHIKAPRLAIIELILDPLPHIRTAGQLLYLSLVQNYMHAPSQLVHEQIFFNITNADSLGCHAAEMSKLAKKLQVWWVLPMLLAFPLA